MKRTAIRCLLAVLLISGCASRPNWVQEGKSDAETDRDYRECYDQTQKKYGTNLESPHFRVDLDQCMESRGYHKG